jgi:hypothetical protein
VRHICNPVPCAAHKRKTGSRPKPPDREKNIELRVAGARQRLSLGRQPFEPTFPGGLTENLPPGSRNAPRAKYALETVHHPNRIDHDGPVALGHRSQDRELSDALVDPTLDAAGPKLLGQAEGVQYLVEPGSLRTLLDAECERWVTCELAETAALCREELDATYNCDDAVGLKLQYEECLDETRNRGCAEMPSKDCDGVILGR